MKVEYMFWRVCKENRNIVLFVNIWVDGLMMGFWLFVCELSVLCVIYCCVKDYFEIVFVIFMRFVVCVNILICSGFYCKDMCL